MSVQTFPSSAFVWVHGKGRASIETLGIRDFPLTFYIRSARTQEMRLFAADSETNEAHEFFDGEGAAYISPDGIQVQIWN